MEPKNIKVRTLTSRRTTSGGSSCLFCYFVRNINAKQIWGQGEIRNRAAEREEELGKASLGETTPFSAAPGGSS